MRLKKQKALVGIQEQSDLYLEKFSKDNEAKDKVRHEISQIEEQLRQVEGQITSKKVKNTGLRSIVLGEQNLQNMRHDIENKTI